MKRAVAGLMGLVLLCGAAALPAAEKLRVGVVDARKILLESKAGQQHRAELEKMVKERRDKLTKEEANIKSLQEKLEKDKLILNDKQKEQKQKEIDDKIAAFKKTTQEAQQEVSKRDGELSTKATVAIREVIDTIAKQEKLAMVIDKTQSGIFWVEEQVDITDKVMKAYETKTPK